MEEAFQKNILSFNTQLSQAGLAAHDLRRLQNLRPQRVVISGMGGSGLAGDLLQQTKKETGIAIEIVTHKAYGLPEEKSSKRTLYVFASFSGNTEETRSGLVSLLKKKPRPALAVLTAVDADQEHNTLLRLSRTHHLPLVTFPARDLTPRQSIGSMFYGLLAILRAAGVPVRIQPFTTLRPSQFKERGRTLARFLKNRIILIYTDDAHSALGYIWKIKCNETGKALAFANVLPEMNHNEIVGFHKLQFPVAALFLVDKKQNPRLKKRFRLTERIIKTQGVNTRTLRLEGKNELEKAWRTIIVADWAAYFLAKSRKVNPTETKIVDALKALMKK